MKLLLRREKNQPDAECILGLFFAGTQSFCSIERPWIPSPIAKGGSSGISCVPPGTYQLDLHHSDAHPYSFALVNPDLDVIHYPDPKRPELRALVLIHSANLARELRGCIALGTRAGKSQMVPGAYQVFDSRKAMRLFDAAVPHVAGHTLEISEAA